MNLVAEIQLKIDSFQQGMRQAADSWQNFGRNASLALKGVEVFAAGFGSMADTVNKSTTKSVEDTKKFINEIGNLQKALENLSKAATKEGLWQGVGGAFTQGPGATGQADLVKLFNEQRQTILTGIKSLEDAASGAGGKQETPGGGTGLLGRIFGSIGSGVTFATIALGSAVGTMLADLGAKALETAKDFLTLYDTTAKLVTSMADMAARGGISIEMFSALASKASEFGVTGPQIGQAMAMFQQEIQKAALATRDTVTAFDKLHISVSAGGVMIKSTSKLFDEAVTKLSQMKEGFEKTRVAQELFGLYGTRLVALLDDIGKEGFAKVTEEARKYGIFISSDLVRASREYESEQSNLHASISRLKLTIGEEMLPAMTAFLKTINDWVRSPEAKEFGNWLLNVVKWVADATTALVKFVAADFWVRLKSDVDMVTKSWAVLADTAERLWTNLKRIPLIGAVAAEAVAGGATKDKWADMDDFTRKVREQNEALKDQDQEMPINYALKNKLRDATEELTKKLADEIKTVKIQTQAVFDPQGSKIEQLRKAMEDQISSMASQFRVSPSSPMFAGMRSLLGTKEETTETPFEKNMHQADMALAETKKNYEELMKTLEAMEEGDIPKTGAALARQEEALKEWSEKNKATIAKTVESINDSFDSVSESISGFMSTPLEAEQAKVFKQVQTIRDNITKLLKQAFELQQTTGAGPAGDALAQRIQQLEAQLSALNEKAVELTDPLQVVEKSFKDIDAAAALLGNSMDPLSEKISKVEAELRLLSSSGKSASDAAKELKVKLESLKEAKVLVDAFDSIESAFNSTLQGVLQGTQTIGDAFKKLGQNILISITESLLKAFVFDRIRPMVVGLAQQIADTLNSNLSQSGSTGIFQSILRFLGLAAGVAGVAGGATAAKGPTAIGGGTPFGGSSIPTWVEGRGGIMPSFAIGGITSGPMLGLVGEVPGQKEAVVPLPDGRRIPVVMQGGGQQQQQQKPNVHVEINGDITPKEPGMTKDQVIRVWVEDFHNGGATRAVTRHYSGLGR